jgi:uncharacterized membrane protein
MPKFHVIVSPDSTPVYPSVRKIGPADLKDVLTKGIDDFLAMPSSLVFLGMIYPIVGVTAIGFVFAVVALSISVVSFPLLLDRDVEVPVAVLTSIKAVWENPFTMALWGLIVAAMLAIGFLLLFVGLAVVVPISAHSSWHLYRRVVDHAAPI